MDINLENIIPAGSRRSKKRTGFFNLLAPGTGNTVELEKNEETELLEMVRKARNEWMDASMSFEHVNDEELVDYFTYKMKACESRYTYFLRKAKEKGINAELQEYPARDGNPTR